MATPLSQSVRDAMKARAQKIKEQQAKGENAQFTRMWALGGKNSIVAPGASVIVRMMPRWDRYVVRDGKVVDTWNVGGKIEVKNLIYVEAMEHWWDGDNNRTNREWCPQMYGDKCPICEAVDELRASADANDRDVAKRIGAKEVAVFNAAVGPTGSRRFGEDGKPDVRPMSVPGTIFLAISNIMTGGEQESFARGDVSDPADGYDLELLRPAAKGQRWTVNCAPQASRLFTQDEAGKWRGWWTQIHNLEELLERETKSYAELYKEFHGVDPEDEPATGGGEAPAGLDVVDDPVPTPAGHQPAQPAQQPPAMTGDGLDGLGDDFPMEPAAAVTPPTTRPATVKAAPPTRRTRR